MVSFGPQIRVTRKSWMKVVAFQATAFRYFAWNNPWFTILHT